MNRPPDVELVLRAYLADTGDRAPDRVLTDVAARIAHHPRPAWRLRGRSFVNVYTKLAAAAAAIVIVAVVGYNVLPRSGVGPPVPTAGPTTAPSPTQAIPSPTLASGMLPAGGLAAGHYTMPEIPGFAGLTLAADIPAGWAGYPEVPAVVSPAAPGKDGVLIGFMKGDGLFSDGCHWDIDGSGSDTQPGDVEVGTTVDSFVNAVRANTSYTSSAPTPVTVGGFQGAEIELQLPGQEVLNTCDPAATGPGEPKFLVIPGGFWAQGPNNIWRLFVVDVNGDRLVTMLNYFGDVPQAELVDARAIVDSFVITP